MRASLRVIASHGRPSDVVTRPRARDRLRLGRVRDPDGPGCRLPRDGHHRVQRAARRGEGTRQGGGRLALGRALLLRLPQGAHALCPMPCPSLPHALPLLVTAAELPSPNCHPPPSPHIHTHPQPSARPEPLTAPAPPLAPPHLHTSHLAGGEHMR
eukprot:3059928-Prymnesium_polylepis.1